MPASNGVSKPRRESKGQIQKDKKSPVKGTKAKSESCQTLRASKQMLNADLGLRLTIGLATKALKRGEVSMSTVAELYRLGDMQKQLLEPVLRKTCNVINRQIADNVLNENSREDTIIKLSLLIFLTLFLFRWDGLIESEKQLSIKLAEKILETYETCSNSSVKQDIIGVAGELPETPVSPQMLNMHLVQLLVLAFAGDAMKSRTVTRQALAKLFNLVEGKHPEVDEIVSALHDKINLIIGADGPETGSGIKMDLVIKLTLMIYTTLFLFRWEMTNCIEQARSLRIAKIIIDTV